MVHLAAAQQHRPLPDAFEFVRDLEVLEKALPGQDLFEQGAQLRNVPLAVAQFIHAALQRLTRGDFETFTKGFVGGLDPQLLVEHQQGWNRLDDRFRVITCGEQFVLQQEGLFEFYPFAFATVFQIRSRMSRLRFPFRVSNSHRTYSRHGNEPPRNYGIARGGFPRAGTNQ